MRHQRAIKSTFLSSSKSCSSIPSLFMVHISPKSSIRTFANDGGLYNFLRTGMKLFPKELSLKQSPIIMREGGLEESHSPELTLLQTFPRCRASFLCDELLGCSISKHRRRRNPLTAPVLLTTLRCIHLTCILIAKLRTVEISEEYRK